MLKMLKRIGNKLIKRNRDDVDYSELKKLIRQTENVKLIDVRSMQEYTEGHLDGAICVPLYELNPKIKEVTSDKDSLMILYCTSGIRSLKGVKILTSMGYKNVYNLKGGLDNI